MNMSAFAHPEAHPDNANLPNINRPATIMGITITFLVSTSIRASRQMVILTDAIDFSYFCHELALMGAHSGSPLGLGRCVCLACGRCEYRWRQHGLSE
jgi:hypothetical protein